MDKPDFQEVEEDHPTVQLADQLRFLDFCLSQADGGFATVREQDLKAVLDLIKERDHRVCWFTTCKNCAAMWDKEFRLYSAVAQLRDEAEKSIAWRQTRGMKPATDTSIFASTSLSGCRAIVRELEAVLGTT